MFVAMCSVARNPEASYQAVSYTSRKKLIVSTVIHSSSTPLAKLSLRLVKDPRLRLSMLTLVCLHARGIVLMVDTDMLAETRRNLPVTIQRRFDVYPDVST